MGIGIVGLATNDLVGGYKVNPVKGWQSDFGLLLGVPEVVE